MWNFGSITRKEFSWQWMVTSTNPLCQSWSGHQDFWISLRKSAMTVKSSSDSIYYHAPHSLPKPQQNRIFLKYDKLKYHTRFNNQKFQDSFEINPFPISRNILDHFPPPLTNQVIIGQMLENSPYPHDYLPEKVQSVIHTHQNLWIWSEMWLHFHPTSSLCCSFQICGSIKLRAI